MKALLVEDFYSTYLQIYKNNDIKDYYNYIVLKGDVLYMVKIEKGRSMAFKKVGKIDKQKYSINGTLIKKPSEKLIYILQKKFKVMK